MNSTNSRYLRILWSTHKPHTICISLIQTRGSSRRNVIPVLRANFTPDFLYTSFVPSSLRRSTWKSVATKAEREMIYAGAVSSLRISFWYTFSAWVERIKWSIRPASDRERELRRSILGIEIQITCKSLTVLSRPTVAKKKRFLRMPHAPP